MITLYVCSKCRGTVTLVYPSATGQVCRPCQLGYAHPDYARSEAGRVGESSPMIRVVFPDKRVVEMRIGKQDEVQLVDSAHPSIGKVRRKFRDA